MNRYSFKRLYRGLIYILLPLSLLCCFNTGCVNTKKAKNGSIYAFSTYIDITLHYEEEQNINEIYQNVINIFNEINKLTNRFEEYQDINNIYTINNSSDFVSVDQKLLDVILLSLELKEETNGYFEPLIGNLSVLYKNIIQNEQLDSSLIPSEDLIESELENIKNSKILVNDNQIRIDGEASLDLGAIAKGYALLKVKEYLESVNITHYIIDAGMSSIIVGEKPIDEYYTVGMYNVNETIEIKNKCLGTSSISPQKVIYENQLYHHIVNPKTGKPDHQFDTVYIIGDNPALIDALTTAFISMTQEEIADLVFKYQEKGIKIEYYLYNDNKLVYKG